MKFLHWAALTLQHRHKQVATELRNFAQQGQHLLSAVAEILADAKTLGWELHAWQRDAPSLPLVSVELDTQSLTPEQVRSQTNRCRCCNTWVYWQTAYCNKQDTSRALVHRLNTPGGQRCAEAESQG